MHKKYKSRPNRNIFGCMRSHGARYINPSCTAFKNSFESLLINNLSTGYSLARNCEEDDSSAHNNLISFLKCTADEESSKNVDSLQYIEIKKRKQISATHAYIAGCLAKKKNLKTV